MAELVLHVDVGRSTGTRNSRRLRRSGHVPAVIYGLDHEPRSVSVAWRELRRALTSELGRNALLSLDVAGEREYGMVKDLQLHPVRRDVIHVDFLRVDPDAELAVDVPVSVVGEATAVTQRRGNVDQAMFTMAVLARPDRIPPTIPVDISELQVGDSIKVGEVPLPDGVVANVREDLPVVVGVATRSTLELERQEKIASGEWTEAGPEGELGEGEAAEGEAAEAGADDA